MRNADLEKHRGEALQVLGLAKAEQQNANIDSPEYDPAVAAIALATMAQAHATLALVEALTGVVYVANANAV